MKSKSKDLVTISKCGSCFNFNANYYLAIRTKDEKVIKINELSDILFEAALTNAIKKLTIRLNLN